MRPFLRCYDDALPVNPTGPVSPSRDPFYRMFGVICAFAIVRLWVLPIANSFWLDETLIAWTIREDFASIIPRAFISLQSIAFCMLEWVVARFSTSEISLRLPSLLAACGTLYLYYRMGVEAADREFGFVLAGLFIAAPAAILEAPNARPYALALFLHTAAVLWLLRWMRSGRWTHGFAWIVCATVAVHFHHLFVTALPMEVIFLIWRIAANATPIRAKHLAGFNVLGVLFLLPALPQALVLSEQRALLSYAGRPTKEALLLTLFPIGVVCSSVIVGLMEWLGGRKPRWLADRPGKPETLLAVLLFVVPTFLYFAASHLTSARIFETRYLLPTFPGLVLLWGWIVRGLEPASFRRLALVGVPAVSLLWVGGFSAIPDYHGEDWRGAARAIPNDVDALVVFPGLVETRRLDWLEAPERKAYFLAPVSTYREDPPQLATFILPFEFEVTDKAYVENLVSTELRSRRKIAVLTRGFFAGPIWDEWLLRRLTREGFREGSGSKFDSIQLRLFERNPSPRAN